MNDAAASERRFEVVVPSGWLYVTLRLGGELSSSATWGSALTENVVFFDVRDSLRCHRLKQKLEWAFEVCARRGLLGPGSELMNPGSDRGGVYRVSVDLAMTCAAIVAGTFLKARDELELVH